MKTGTNWSAGTNISWRPTERLTLSAGYVHEWDFTKQLQWTIFPGTSPPTLQPSYKWLSDSAHTIYTYHLNLNAILIPQQLDANLGWSYSAATGTTKTRNTNPPPSGLPPGMNAQALALRYPAIEDELLRIDIGLTYHFDKVWTATLGYALETWNKKDFRTDNLTPSLNNITSIFLGEDYKNYTVNIVSLTLGYRFK